MVVIAVLPDGEYGKSSAACVARDLLHTFPNVRVGLMVGIGGGAPSQKNDIRLGDIVVGTNRRGKSGVLHYDFGDKIQNQPLQLTGFTNQAPPSLRAAISGLKAHYEGHGHTIKDAIDKALVKRPRLQKKYKYPGNENDRLYQSHIIRRTDEDEGCPGSGDESDSVLIPRPQRSDNDDDPMIHYGIIASGDQLMMDASIRDRLSRDHNVLCFEMEAAGLVNSFPCLIIRGICDYSDTHKNDQWQGYAAMVAAAYAKDLLLQIIPSRIESEAKIVDVLSVLDKSVNNLIGEVKPVTKIIHSKHDRDILEWLTSHDYGISHKDIFTKAEPGTGQWFIYSQTFETWLHYENRNLLCLGNPGAGKTVITSMVVSRLLSEFGKAPDIGIAYIYCNYQRHTEQKATDILSSLLRQLAQARSPLPKSVQDLYDSHERSRTYATLEQISEALFSVAGEYSKVYIIIDALDECNASENTRATVLRELFRLQNHMTANIFATSRPNKEVSNFFSGSLTLNIAATDDDIRKYLDKQISLNESLILDDPLKVEIKDKIVSIADGMFLLASLQTATVLSQPTKGDLLETLETLNQGELGLNEHYDQAMKRIQDQEPKRKALAMNILTWIVHSKRPLSLMELQHALAVRRNAKELDTNFIPCPEIILSLCAGLVVLDQGRDVVRLVHYTTQEYFERERKVWFEDAETEMIITCGTYLSFASGTENIVRLKTDLPLYSYALYHWNHHVREIPGRASEWLLRLAKSKIKIPFGLTERQLRFRHLPPPRISGLHLAAYFDLRQAAAHLIGSGSCVDEHDDFDRTPLSYAAAAGREAIVILLLMTGDVDPNCSPKAGTFEGTTPLMLAATHQHEAVVDLLLKVHDIDINAQNFHGHTALSYAVVFGNMSIVAGLCKKGANMEIKYNGGQTVLEVAVGQGNTSMVEFLLNSGANPNPTPTTGTGGTPLWSAAGRGDADIVKLLLDQGADPYLRSRPSTLPLSLAASEGRVEVVKVLLQWGVDPEDVSDASRTPFSLAAEGGHMAIVKLLLDTGKVNPDSKSSQDRTPLSYASGSGHEAVVELLLGACRIDPDFRDSQDRTPLSHAAGCGHKSVVELLIGSCRVDPDFKDSKGRTPLSHAAGGGHEAAVELLLGTYGVDPNSRAEKPAGMTPLGFAAYNGKLAIVKILLNDDRVDPDWRLSRDGEGGPTELFRAASHGRKTVLRLLLDTNRVDVNSRDSNGWTPLDYAKNGDIRRMLREKGAKRGKDL